MPAAYRHACALLTVVLLVPFIQADASGGQRSTLSSRLQPIYQPRCTSPAHPAGVALQQAPPEWQVSPFPASFWLVKTIKTGGTTIASVLRQICGQYGVVPVNKRRINPLEQMPDAKAATALHGLVQGANNATDASEFAIITHLNFSHAKLAAFQSALGGRKPLLFTAVRHPLPRTYSHFIQAKCANAAAILGGKIIECDTNTTFMAKLLERDSIRNRWSFVKVPSRHNLMFNYIRGDATTAEAALEPYDFVFVSERMDEGEDSTQLHSRRSHTTVTQLAGRPGWTASIEARCRYFTACNPCITHRRHSSSTVVEHQAYVYWRTQSCSPCADMCTIVTTPPPSLPPGLVLFMLLYGLKLQDIAYLPSKVRTGKYKPSEQMPAALNEYVLSANSKDLQLWQHANKLLDARRAKLEQQCGTGVIADAIAAFKALQAEVAVHCSDFKAWYADHDLPARQYTYVNDEGWGWRCVRHVAQLHMEGYAGTGVGVGGADTALGSVVGSSKSEQAVTLIT